MVLLWIVPPSFRSRHALVIIVVKVVVTGLHFDVIFSDIDQKDWNECFRLQYEK